MNERLKERLLPIVFCVGGLVLGHHKMVLSGFAFTQSDLGDTRFTSLLLEHAWLWLTGAPLHADLWTPPSFYPVTGHVVWNENMVGAALLYFPFRVIGMRPDNAYQAWAVATGALNFVATYFLLRRAFKFDALASSLGAMLFAFSAVRINQTMHWQLFPHYFTAWAAHASYRLANASELKEQQRVWWVAVLAFSVVGQIWASIYLGWYLLFVFVVGLGLGLCWTKTRVELWALLKGHPYTLALTALVSLAALYPLGWRYLATAGQFGGRPFEEALSMLPMPHVWLHMGKDSWFWGWLAAWPAFQRIPMEHEQRCGFGLIATAVAAFAFIKYRKEQRLVFVGVLLVVLLFITTLYSPDGTTPWRIVHAYFPGAQAIRAVARASIVYMLGVAIGAAAVVHALAQQEKTKWLALPLAGVLFFEQGYDTPAYSKADDRRDIAAVKAAIDPDCEVFLMSPAQGYGPYWKYQLDAMWAAVETGIPTFNGYAGQNPQGWGLTDTNLRDPRDEQRVAYAAQQWINAQPSVKGKKICWARVGFSEGPNFSSEFVSHKAPPVLKASEVAPVEVSFKNTGPREWPMQAGIRLGVQAPQDGSQWGVQRVELPQPVAVGETVTFRFNITAPPQVGKQSFQWRMLSEGVQWIGALSKIQLIEIVPSPVPELLQAPAPDAGS